MNTAAEKRAALWTKIQKDAYAADELPQQAAVELVRGLAHAPNKNAYLLESFTHDQDVLPRSRPIADLPATRHGHPRSKPKIFHACGTTALVVYNPRGSHTWTGLLAAQTFGILRASLTNTDETFSPGFGLKLFVDGAKQPTRNTVAMYRLEGQGFRDRNFFANPLNTFVPPPRQNQSKFPFGTGFYEWRALEGVFEGAMAWQFTAKDPPSPLVVPLHHLCAINPNGTPVATTPDHPKHLSFRPSTDAARGYRQTSHRDDFRTRLGTLPSDTWLYTVHDPTGAHIGDIHLQSRFIASPFGDDELFFQHAMPIPKP